MNKVTWETYEILVAHESNPEEFKHEVSISVIGEYGDILVDEICGLLNNTNNCDCTWKRRPNEKSN